MRRHCHVATPKRIETLQTAIGGPLNDYIGSVQVHLIGDERWGSYATFRLQMGVDVYFLAQQMGTSVQMIEKHYGHVNTIRHADRVLMGMEGWDPVTTASPADAQAEGDATDRQSAKVKHTAKPKPSRRSKR